MSRHIRKCSDCGKLVDSKYNECPYCGNEQLWFAVIQEIEDDETDGKINERSLTDNSNIHNEEESPAENVAPTEDVRVSEEVGSSNDDSKTEYLICSVCGGKIPVGSSNCAICGNDEMERCRKFFEKPEIKRLLIIEKTSGVSVNIPECGGVFGRAGEIEPEKLAQFRKISRIHGEFIVSDGEYAFSDNNSKNHTYINDEVIVPHVAVPVRPGDTISFGSIAFMVKEQ